MVYGLWFRFCCWFCFIVVVHELMVIQVGQKRRGFRKSGEARMLKPIPFGIPKIHGRQAEYVHALQQFKVGRRIARHIGL